MSSPKLATLDHEVAISRAGSFGLEFCDFTTEREQTIHPIQVSLNAPASLRSYDLRISQVEPVKFGGQEEHSAQEVEQPRLCHHRDELFRRHGDSALREVVEFAPKFADPTADRPQRGESRRSLAADISGGWNFGPTMSAPPRLPCFSTLHTAASRENESNRGHVFWMVLRLP